MRKVRMIVLLLCVTLALCACMMPEENQTMKSQTQALMDAIIADDQASVRSMISSTVSNAEFETFYKQARQVFGGVGAYTLKQLNWNTNVNNGVTVQQAQFVMTAGEETYLLQIVISSEMEGIAGFRFDVYEETVTTGTWLTMADADGAQWVFLLIGLAEIGLVIWAVVDCARSKIKNKALWIVLILLGAVVCSFTAVKGNVSFNFNLGVFLTHTALIRYSTGGFMLRMYLPIGMVVYWILRSRLRADAARREAAALAAQEYPAPVIYTQSVAEETVVENNQEETATLEEQQ